MKKQAKRMEQIPVFRYPQGVREVDKMKVEGKTVISPSNPTGGVQSYDSGGPL